MCGIAGYYGEGDTAALSRMAGAIAYRGPDDSGTYEDRGVGLAHRRLSIIDISAAGHQPMANDDGTVWVAFNGEIYNFRELRRELAASFTFKSKTDTEVIIRLYEKFGTAAFSKLEGMFAIALYDKHSRTLFLARDRMGKKPLYWGVYDGTFLFGSELKALRGHPKFTRELDLSSVNKYFLYESVPTPHSIFKDTFKLEPGTVLSWDGKKAEKSTFWRPTFMPKVQSFPDALTQLDTVLGQAVSDRLVADVPVGVFLSGGIDSSTVAYYASKASKTKVRTFSIGFREDAFDESAYARRVAAHLGTEHLEKVLEAEEGVDIIPDVLKMLDEPMADSSIIPTYLLSRFVREHVTVSLGGDGGDELLFGYENFVAHRLAEWYARISLPIRKRVIERAIAALPPSFSGLSLDVKAKVFVKGFYGEPEHRNQRWLGAFDRDERSALFTEPVWSAVEKENEFDDIDAQARSCDSSDPYDRLAQEYERIYLMDDVLVKVDRASMYNSLEVRSPFLDTRVVELANHLPTSFKLRGLEKKHILKKLMEGRLPGDVVYRKKKGFSMPIGAWMRADLKPMVTDLLSADALRPIGLFNQSTVDALLREHFDGTRDNRKQIWALLVFSAWYQRWMS